MAKQGGGEDPKKESIKDYINKNGSKINLKDITFTELKSILKEAGYSYSEISNFESSVAKLGDGTLNNGYKEFKETQVNKDAFDKAPEFELNTSLNQDKEVALSEITPEGYENKHFNPWVKKRTRVKGAGSTWEEEDDNSDWFPEGTFKKDTPTKTRGGGSGGGGYKKTVAEQVNDVDLDANGNSTEEYVKIANENKINQLMAQYQELESRKKFDYDKSYAPDEQLPDFASPIGDAGRALLGFAGTQEDLPDYKPSEMMAESLGDARRQKEIGLSAEEENYRTMMADRGYAADISNIRRMSGGSSGVALANMGRAAGTLQDSYAQTAAMDEAVRRQAEGRFDQAAVKAEAINRYAHEEDYNEVMMNKQAGAGLMNDAFTNMRERADFNKYYGKGSAHYELMKENVMDSRQSMALKEFAAEQNLLNQKAKLRNDITDIQYQNDPDAAMLGQNDRNKEFSDPERNGGEVTTNNGNSNVDRMLEVGAIDDNGYKIESKSSNPIEVENGKPVYGGTNVVRSRDMKQMDPESPNFIESAANKGDNTMDFLEKSSPFKARIDELNAKLQEPELSDEEYTKMEDELRDLDEKMIKWVDDKIVEVDRYKTANPKKK